MSAFQSVITWSLVSLILAPQTVPVLFVKSWKSGKARIEERQLDLVLTTNTRSVRSRIRNESGSEKYELSATEAKGLVAANSWSIKLRTKKSLASFFSYDADVNLLQPSNDPYQDTFSKEDGIASFSKLCEQNIPGMTIPLCVSAPLLQERVVQVEGFYVILRVLDYKVGEKAPYELTSLSLRVVFTNNYEQP